MKHDSLVLAVQFSPDGKIWTFTSHWLHIAELTPDGLRPLADLPAFLGWQGDTPALFPKDCAPCDRFTLAERNGGTLWLREIDLQAPEHKLQGNPTDLLEEWKRKLALDFDEYGEVVPRWEPPAPTAASAANRGAKVTP